MGTGIYRTMFASSDVHLHSEAAFRVRALTLDTRALVARANAHQTAECIRSLREHLSGTGQVGAAIQFIPVGSIDSSGLRVYCHRFLVFNARDCIARSFG